MLVYKATSKTSGKSYIGITTRFLKRRIQEHRFLMDKEKYNFRFYRALRKYGFKDFKWSILEDRIINIKILENREKYWIKFYDTLRNGYNMTKGGHSCYELTNKIRQKMGKSHSGKKNYWYGKGHLMVGKNNPHYGHKHSQKTKRLLSKLAINKYTGKKNPCYGKGYLFVGSKNHFYGKHHTRKSIKKIIKNQIKKRNFVYDLIPLKNRKTYKNVINLKEFSKKHNLNHLCFWTMARDYREFDGWKIIKKKINKNDKGYRNQKYKYDLISIYRPYKNIKCLKNFCKRNKLIKGYNQLFGFKRYRGWRLIKRRK